MITETVDTTQEETFFHQSGLVCSAKFLEQIQPIRTKLPQFIYIDSFSHTYGVSSQDDWLLVVVQYDTRFHRLVQTIVQFAIVDEKSDSYIHLPAPAFLEVKVMKADAWFTYGDQIYQALIKATYSVLDGNSAQNPKHTITNHSLLPTFKLGPCYSQ